LRTPARGGEWSRAAILITPAAAAPEAGQYVPVSPVTVVDNVSLPAGGTTTATTAVVAANGAVYSSRSTGITAHHP
jgi:hypothetical protein